MATMLYDVVVWTFEDGDEARPSVLLRDLVFAGSPAAARSQAEADARGNPDYAEADLEIAVSQFIPLGGR
jgi:hypothetical protein